MVSNERQSTTFTFAGTQTGMNTVPDPKVTHGLLGVYKMVRMGFKAGHTLFHQGGFNKGRDQLF